MTSDSSYVQLVSASKHRLWKNRSPVLGRLDMELTERCNNNCVHRCINLSEDDLAREREISPEDAKRILTEAASFGCLSVRFTGVSLCCATILRNYISLPAGLALRYSSMPSGSCQSYGSGTAEEG
jgi:hypothetical protein